MEHRFCDVHSVPVLLRVLSCLSVLLSGGCVVLVEGACVLRFDISPDDSVFVLSGSVSSIGTINQAPEQTLKLTGALHVSFPLPAGAACPPTSGSALALAGASFVDPPATARPRVVLTPADVLARVEVLGSALANITLMDVSFGITSGPIPPPSLAGAARAAPFSVNQTWTFESGLANVSLSDDLAPLSGAYIVPSAGDFTVTGNTAIIAIRGLKAQFQVAASGQDAIINFKGNVSASLKLGCPSSCSLLGVCSGPVTGRGCSCDCDRSDFDCSTAVRPHLVLNSSSVSPPNSTTLVVSGPGIGEALAATPTLQVLVSNTSCSNAVRIDADTVQCTFAPTLARGKAQYVVLAQGCQATLRAKQAIVSSFGTASGVATAPPRSGGRPADIPPQPSFGSTAFDKAQCPNGIIPAACYGYPASANVTGACSCACNGGWSGLDCGTCTNDDSCKAKRCDTTPYYSAGTKAKHYACTAGADLTAVIQPSVSFNCDVEAAFCRLILVVNNTEATPVFCSGTDCKFNQRDVVISGSDAEVSCSSASCSCDTSNRQCPTAIETVLSQVQGLVTMKCSGSGRCELSVGGLLAVVPAKCTFGECTDADAVTFKYSRTNWRAVGIALGVALAALIASIFLFLFLRKRYRRRREGEFTQWLSTKPEGPGRTLTASNVSVHTMASYNQYVEGLGKSVMGHSLYHKLNRWVVGPDNETYRRELVSGVSLSLRRGQMLALMGPSGSGKTTLLNILAAVGGGRMAGTKAHGSIAVDGLPRDASFRQLAAYVPQEDFLHSSLSVRESIEYSAKLRLPAYMPPGQKQERVRHVIDVLGLAPVAENRVGSTALGPGLSGGERRRVRIGMELVVDPRVLLLDEPTSGLDSSAAARLVQTLREISEAGAIVVLSVHQPSQDVFRQFDQILLLSARGRPVYSGSRQSIADHFKDIGYPCPTDRNFADHMMDVVSKFEGSDDIPLAQNQPATMYHKGRESVEIENGAPTSSRNKGLSLRQTLRNPDFKRSLVSEVAVMYWSEMTNIVRRPTLLGLHLLLAAVLGTLVGGVFFNVPDDLTGFQNRAGAMFFSIALFSFCSLSALEAFITERIIFTAEGSSRYFCVFSYFLSKLTLDWLFLRILPVIVYCSVMYWMVGLRAEAGKFVMFTIWLSLTAIISGGICSWISLVISSVGPANIVAIIIVLLQLLFGGFMVKLDSIHQSLRWLHYLSYPYYAFENLVTSDLEGKTLLFKPSGATTAIPVKAEIFLETFGLHEKYRTRNSWVLVIFVSAVAVLTYIMLLLRIRQATNLKLSPARHTSEDRTSGSNVIGGRGSNNNTHGANGKSLII